jgi:hypothetical protein
VCIYIYIFLPPFPLFFCLIFSCPLIAKKKKGKKKGTLIKHMNVYSESDPQGLWMGNIVALFVQGLSLLIITLRIDWEKESKVLGHGKLHI